MPSRSRAEANEPKMKYLSAASIENELFRLKPQSTYTAMEKVSRPMKSVKNSRAATMAIMPATARAVSA